MAKRITRAQRFRAQGLILYRACGDNPWQEADLEDISRSGILFRTDKSLDVDTPVEISFVLPVETVVAPGTEVICWGAIVRSVVPTATTTQPAMAAKFFAYQPLLVRAESAPRLLYWDNYEREASERAQTPCEFKASS